MAVVGGYHYLPGRGREATGEPWDAGSAGGYPESVVRWRSWSRGGVSGLADGAEQFVAGALNGLGGVEVGGCRGKPVERFEGDAGPEEALGAGERLEALVWGGDVLLGVSLPDLAVGAGDRGGEEAGPVEVEEGGEGVAEEVVGLGDEIVGGRGCGRATCRRCCRSWTRPARCRSTGGAWIW